MVLISEKPIDMNQDNFSEINLATTENLRCSAEFKTTKSKSPSPSTARSSSSNIDNQDLPTFDGLVGAGFMESSSQESDAVGPKIPNRRKSWSCFSTEEKVGNKRKQKAFAFRGDSSYNDNDSVDEVFEMNTLHRPLHKKGLAKNHKKKSDLSVAQNHNFATNNRTENKSKLTMKNEKLDRFRMNLIFEDFSSQELLKSRSNSDW